MSEAFITVFFLTLSGGLQDAYSYHIRGEVFANAQTGNFVLMSTKLFSGDFISALNYLIPILAFISGILTAELILHAFARSRYLQRRQMVLLLEIVLLLIVGFLPQKANMLANALVSFSCAMQVQSFRKVNGLFFASTMCIGNLRSATEALSGWIRTGDAFHKERFARYALIILTFTLGAGIGSVLADCLLEKLILLSSLLLFISFILMFKKTDQG